jgi:tetratricopeptide (TPR) repeat protein
MNRHPDPEALRRFKNGELPVEEASRIDRHLGICFECRDRADEASSDVVVRLIEETLISAGYDEAFERAGRRAARTLAGLMEEARGAEALLADLLREPGPMRRRRIRTEERFQIFELSQLLRLRSREAWFTEPAVALEIADLAVEVARHLDAGRYGSCFVEGSRALAWAYLCNAWRINSDLWKAEAAMLQAWIHHEQAGRDTYTETELLHLTASLRSTQGFSDEAVRLSDQVIAIYGEVRDRQLEGFAMIQKGFFLMNDGRNDEAIPVLRAGLERVDPEANFRAWLAGKHSLVCSLVGSGAPGEAWQLLEEIRPVYRDVDFPMSCTRLRWLEGEIARALGRFVEAEAVFHEVREFFADRKLGIDVFLASLSLAEVYAAGGRRRQVKEVLGEVIPLGEALGIRRHVLAARLLYEQAARG